MIEGSEIEILTYLKTIFIENNKLSEIDIRILKDYESTNYAMNGLIGLVINCKARILLGKKQVYYSDIQNWCKAVETNNEDLELIADKYLDNNFVKSTDFPP